MGDWGADPWENDEAADWFHKFWKTGMQLVINDVEMFDPKSDNYNSIRAAAHVIISFGSPYTWPESESGKRKEIINKMISILNKMINPPNENWLFLDDIDNDEKIISSVENQIRDLQKLL